jgi:hypothetical protein
MKPPHYFSCLLGIVLLGLGSCGKARSVKAQLDQLKQAFPAVQNGNPGGDQPQASDPNAYVKAALAAAQTNDYAGGVIALQAAQQLPQMNAAQLQALQGAMQALTADLVARAARGDAQAQAELATIEKTRSQ